MTEINYCTKHPNKQTNLRCNRCNELICPRCMVASPVGIRCLNCGKSTPLPTKSLTSYDLVKAIATSITLGLLAGFIFLLVIIQKLPFTLITVLASMALWGYILGQVISLVTGKKRGLSLQIIGIVGIVMSFFPMVLFQIWFVSFDLFYIFGLGFGIYIIIIRLR